MGYADGRRSVAALTGDAVGLVGRADKSCMDAERDTQVSCDCGSVSGLRGQIVCCEACMSASECEVCPTSCPFLGPSGCTVACGKEEIECPVVTHGRQDKKTKENF